MVFRDFVAPSKTKSTIMYNDECKLTNKALFKVVKAHYTPYGNLR